MRIGIVGGLERTEPVFRRMAVLADHSVEFHRGDVGGRGSGSLESLVARADLIIVLTDVNSHGSVLLARKLAKEKRVRLLLVRRLSLSRFAGLLEALSSAAPLSEAV
jgi:hypothetical protein